MDNLSHWLKFFKMVIAPPTRKHWFPEFQHHRSQSIEVIANSCPFFFHGNRLSFAQDYTFPAQLFISVYSHSTFPLIDRYTLFMICKQQLIICFSAKPQHIPMHCLLLYCFCWLNHIVFLVKPNMCLVKPHILLVETKRLLVIPCCNP